MSMTQPSGKAIIHSTKRTLRRGVPRSGPGSVAGGAVRPRSCSWERIAGS